MIFTIGDHFKTEMTIFQLDKWDKEWERKNIKNKKKKKKEKKSDQTKMNFKFESNLKYKQ